MILFFDTYITSSSFEAHRGFNSDKNSKKRFELVSFLRSKNNNYRYQEKIDIVKYTLLSYSKINWEQVIIRFECQDQSKNTEFTNFCKNLFPNAFIENVRSDSAKKYINAFKNIKNQNNPWIFFSPNNDHVNLERNNEYTSIIKDAEFAEKKFPGYNVSILYSHYSEAMNSYSPKKSLWGYYGGNLQKKIYETDNALFILNSRLMCDSIKIFRLNFLLSLFENQDEKKRIIRLEDTNYYLNEDIKEIQIVPKIELCRHYDGYQLLFFDPPPLFIPPGFFENDVKIRFMMDGYDANFVNINPFEEYVFNGGNADLKILLEDLPVFWKERVTAIIKKPDNIIIRNKNDLTYYKNLVNPWNKMSTILNLFLSLLRLSLLKIFANWIVNLFVYKIKIDK
jgi:hypothetical protein